MPLAAVDDGFGVEVAQAVAHVFLGGIELEEVAGRCLEAHALTGLGKVVGGDAFGRDAVGVQVAFQLGQRLLVAHLEAVEVHAGAIGLFEDEAVVVTLVEALEEGPSGLVIVAHGLEAHDLGIEADRFVQIHYAQLAVARPHHA